MNAFEEFSEPTVYIVDMMWRLLERGNLLFAPTWIHERTLWKTINNSNHEKWIWTLQTNGPQLTLSRWLLWGYVWTVMVCLVK